MCRLQAGTGVYCGPLRLLAWEVAEKLNAGGVPCSLVTGQERREVEGARHAACTVGGGREAGASCFGGGKKAGSVVGWSTAHPDSKLREGVDWES